VRGEEDDAAAGGVGRLDQLGAVPLHGHGRAEPQARRLGGHAPGVGHGGAHLGQAVAGRAEFSAKRRR
jgi:hypothetical protein